MFAQNFCKFEANSWHLVTDARDDLFEELTWQVLCVRDWVRVGRMSTAIQKIRAIAIATVVVAILDIGEDMIYCRLYLHVGPRGLFRFIASSVLGLSDAMSLGWRAVLLGVVLHTAVSFGVVLAYFFPKQRPPDPATAADHDGHPIWNRSLLRDALWHRAPDGGS